MQIRAMTIEDYGEVYALWACTPGMGLNALDDSMEGIGRYLRRNPNTCFVAEESGELVGVILSGHDGRRGFIYHTAVNLAQRGKGIGSALVGHALCALREEGIGKVALVAFSENEKGNAFWARQGFSLREDLCYRNKVIGESKALHT